MSSILIGLHGVKQSGKDTTADFIEKFAAVSDPPLSSMRRGFADKGKLAFMRQFIPDITMAEALKTTDRFKEDSRAVISFPYVRRVDGFRKSEYITFRNALAQFCTEGGRDVYGDDHWVDQLLPLGWDQFRNPFSNWQMSFISPPQETPADVCLIRDLRFDNELARIQGLGGMAIKIRRKDAEQAVIEEAKRQGREVHRSELGLDDSLFDYVINNDDNDLNLAQERTREVWENICGYYF